MTQIPGWYEWAYSLSEPVLYLACVLVTALFVLSYGSLVYMIVTNDRPFSGHVIVTPEPIEHALAVSARMDPNAGG